MPPGSCLPQAQFWAFFGIKVLLEVTRQTRILLGLSRVPEDGRLSEERPWDRLLRLPPAALSTAPLGCLVGDRKEGPLASPGFGERNGRGTGVAPPRDLSACDLPGQSCRQSPSGLPSSPPAAPRTSRCPRAAACSACWLLLGGQWVAGGWGAALAVILGPWSDMRGH